MIAAQDQYTVAAGRVLTVDANTGVLANDRSTTNFGAVLTASQVGAVQFLTTANGNTTTVTRPVPANTLTLNPNGSFTFIAPSDLPANVTTARFTYRASNVNDPTEPSGTGTVTITITGTQQKYIAVGADAGGMPMVNVYAVGTGQLVRSFMAYESSFTGGVRVATADLNNDGIDDIITAPGFGGGPRIEVFDGASGGLIYDQFAFADPNYRGGAYVAAGDFAGTGTPDIYVGAGETGGPRVQIIQPTFAGGVGASVLLADFYAYEPSFTSGVRVAAGDLEGNGQSELVTSPGAGGGPVVKVFTADSVLNGGTSTPPARLSFYAGATTARDGLFVATGDLSGNGMLSIITGNGSGTPLVQVFNGQNGGLIRQITIPTDDTPIGSQTTTQSSTSSTQTSSGGSGSLLAGTTVPNAITGSSSVTARASVNGSGGVRVTAADFNGDGLADVITGAGPGYPARVRVINTTDNTELTNFLAFPTGFLGGIQVG